MQKNHERYNFPEGMIAMLENYLIVHRSILPPHFEAVLRARRLLEEGKVKEVNRAVEQAGISRSTFYKYKDFILEPSALPDGRKAVFSLVLAHETGVLGALLMEISKSGCSVLTITQSLPIRGRASVTVSLDISGMAEDISGLIRRMEQVDGVENAHLVAVE